MDYLSKPFIAVMALCLVALVASVASAGPSADFELGAGRNYQAIGADYAGLNFGTVNGKSLLYFDINSHWYSARSDNGTTWLDGEYFMSGNVAAGLSDLSDQGVISVTGSPVDYISVSYSSRYNFYMDAYDAGGSLLASVSGPANCTSGGGTGLRQLSISTNGIARVVVHDHGGYWMIDNVTTTPVPEPCVSVVLAFGAAGLVPWVRYRRQRRRVHR